MGDIKTFGVIDSAGREVPRPNRKQEPKRELKTRYKYIHFWEVPNDRRKTKYFQCRNNKTDDLLGAVQWERGWRQYCFCPVYSTATVFSKGCLEDVNDFIGQLMDERKKGISS